MPLTGPIPEGGTFFCPHCGALFGDVFAALCRLRGQCAASITSAR
jgi:hypothetical protein